MRYCQSTRRTVGLWACALLFAALAAPSFGASDPTSQAGFDGPAELPRIYLKSTLADTPAPGKVHRLKEGDSLQAAFDKAKCGDTIELQPGATYRGFFQIPEKACDDDHWIVVRTGAPNESLPAEGTRITPCYAGVASLPGRPDFQCSSPRNVMARIEYDQNSGSGPLAFLKGANHYRFVGLEITRADSEAPITALGFVREKDGTVHHLIFDRVWMHGTPQGETARGLAMVAMTYVAVVDSYFSDFHCVAITGSCTDAQALGSSGGDFPGGPYKIVNNFLEASGENILFGGGGATMTPADIEIRRNHLFKPMTWRQGEPGFVGGTSGHPFIVKNHFELKNAQRVLFEGNLLENNWGGFSQSGFSVLLTPKNQNNHCPSCRVTDITVRYCKISNVGSVFQIANGLSDAGGASSGGGRYSIHDVVVDQVRKDFRGFGVFALIGSSTPVLENVRIEHVTAVVPAAIITVLNTSGQKIPNIVISNNIFSATGIRQVGNAGGGPKSCAFQPDSQGPEGVLKSCFTNLKFTNNLIIGGGHWPEGNIIVKDANAAGIPGMRESARSDFKLCRDKDETCKKTSPALKGASDGKDIGADLEAIEAAIAGTGPAHN